MNTGRGLLEIIFVIFIIFFIMGIFAVYITGNLKDAMVVGMNNELTNLRNSVELYMILEGRYPDDLRDLDRACKVSGRDSLYGRKYFEFERYDGERYPVDPYGRRFLYNNKTGEVKRDIK